MTMDYKALDTRKIRDYIDASDGMVAVDDIIRNSGADKLRWNTTDISRWRSGKSLERPSLFAEKEA